MPTEFEMSFTGSTKNLLSALEILAEHDVNMNTVDTAKIGDKFVDIDIAPIATASLEENATWTDEDEALINRVLDTLTDMDSELAIQHRH